MLSAVPGFWPAVIVLSTALLALLLPGLAVLAGLIALQLPAYLAWKRVTWRRVIAAQTRHAPIEEIFFRVRTISR